jgi:hypothetical protein
MRSHLKVKIASLAAEAKIIRRVEGKTLQRSRYKRSKGHDPVAVEVVHQEFMSLRVHRKFDVRQEARGALLALAFMNGKLYRQVENPPKTKDRKINQHFTLPFDKMQANVLKFSRIGFGTDSKTRSAFVREHLMKWINDGGPGWSEPATL